MLNDNLLRIEKKSQTESRWKCCVEGCRFRCKLDEMDNVQYTHGEHTHPPNPAGVEAKRVRMAYVDLKTSNDHGDTKTATVHAQDTCIQNENSKHIMSFPGNHNQNSLDIRRQIVEQSSVTRDYVTPAMAAGILPQTYAGNKI